MPVIYVIGDSTVEDNKPPFRGWGYCMPEFVAEGVTVRNHALSGRSSKSFLDEGLFEPVRENIAAGDLLLIQFGHNDEKPDEERRTEPDSTFPEKLSIYIDTALNAGALPVLMTPVSRRHYNEDGTMKFTHGAYPDAIRKLAAERGVALIDLLALSRALYISLGQDKTAELFVRLAPGENADFPDGHDDPTHFNATGAETICGLVVDGLRGIGQIRPLLAE